MAGHVVSPHVRLFICPYIAVDWAHFAFMDLLHFFTQRRAVAVVVSTRIGMIGIGMARGHFSWRLPDFRRKAGFGLLAILVVAALLTGGVVERARAMSAAGPHSHHQHHVLPSADALGTMDSHDGCAEDRAGAAAPQAGSGDNGAVDHACCHLASLNSLAGPVISAESVASARASRISSIFPRDQSARHLASHSPPAEPPRA